MAKSTRALSGAAKDAYLKRAIGSDEDIPAPARDRLTAKLRGEIASVSLRSAEAAADKPAVAGLEGSTAAAPVTGFRANFTDAHNATPAGPVTCGAFDPYSPNVIVIIRTRGRQAVLDQLGRIDDIDKLRLLAREQQLGIAADLANPDAIRNAIVAAAERRIANRRAAAS